MMQTSTVRQSTLQLADVWYLVRCRYTFGCISRHLGPKDFLFVEQGALKEQGGRVEQQLRVKLPSSPPIAPFIHTNMQDEPKAT